MYTNLALYIGGEWKNGGGRVPGFGGVRLLNQ